MATLDSEIVTDTEGDKICFCPAIVDDGSVELTVATLHFGAVAFLDREGMVQVYNKIGKLLAEYDR